MRLYVCYGTWRTLALRPGGHPCGKAHEALVNAGYDPEVKRSYGLGGLPGIFNRTPGRQEVKRLTGDYWVPVLVQDDGTVVQGSRQIIEWAKANPAGGSSPTPADPPTISAEDSA
jgi:Glutathione S-transferase, N-terminal domain